jgi:hypothetical protein
MLPEVLLLVARGLQRCQHAVPSCRGPNASLKTFTIMMQQREGDRSQPTLSADGPLTPDRVFPSLDGAVFDAPALRWGCFRFRSSSSATCHCSSDAGEQYRRGPSWQPDSHGRDTPSDSHSFQTWLNGGFPLRNENDLELVGSVVARMRSGRAHAHLLLPEPGCVRLGQVMLGMETDRAFFHI